MNHFKKTSLLAVPAICLSLTSCSRDYEEYLDAATDLSEDAAEVLNSCMEVEDADATADKLIKLANKLKSLKKDFMCSYVNDVRGYVYDPDKDESSRRSALRYLNNKHKEIQNDYREMNMEWKSAVQRINGNEQLSKQRYLNYAIERFDSEYEFFMNRSEIFGS